MAHPPDHAFRSVPATPSAFSQASTGAAAFQSWLEEEEEEWCLGRMLEANCPKEFICPISLDIMSDPIILVRCVPHSQTLSVTSARTCGCSFRLQKQGLLCPALRDQHHWDRWRDAQIASYKWVSIGTMISVSIEREPILTESL